MCEKSGFEGEFQIKILKNNFMIQFYINVGDKVVSGSKTVFYSNKIHHLSNIINNSIDVVEDEKVDENTHKMKIKLVDMKNSSSKTLHYNINITSEAKEYLENIKERLLNKNIIDIYRNRYKVSIINCYSSKSDIASFSINTKDDMKQVIQGLNKILNVIFEENLNNNIVFSDDKFVGNTHRIQIQKKGESIRSFSIKFPNFSSSELRNLLVNEINGGMI